MSNRLIFLALFFILCLSSWAYADGGFYGYVNFKYCDCETPYQWISIYHIETQESFTCPLRCGVNPGYNTNSNWPYNTFPPGTYQLTVVVDPAHTNCLGSPVVQRVVHGLEWQQVDLKCWGPLPEPSRPQGP